MVGGRLVLKCSLGPIRNSGDAVQEKQKHWGAEKERLKA